MKRFGVAMLIWLGIAVLVTLIMLGIYAAVQQSYRQSANDPQIQMAEDARDDLVSGKLQPQQIVARYLVNGKPIDITKSLSPFITIYDESGNVLETSGVLAAVNPVPPAGVFAAAKASGENRVTWQPSENTRVALVVVPAPIESGWFVAAGRNLREVEKREDALASGLFFGWMVAMGASFLAMLLYGLLRAALPSAKV